jgi:hypothetical protein
MAMSLQSLEFTVRPQPYAIVPDLKRDNATRIMPAKAGQSDGNYKGSATIGLRNRPVTN